MFRVPPQNLELPDREHLPQDWRACRANCFTPFCPRKLMQGPLLIAPATLEQVKQAPMGVVLHNKGQLQEKKAWALAHNTLLDMCVQCTCPHHQQLPQADTQENTQ